MTDPQPLPRALPERVDAAPRRVGSTSPSLAADGATGVAAPGGGGGGAPPPPPRLGGGWAAPGAGAALVVVTTAWWLVQHPERQFALLGLRPEQLRAELPVDAVWACIGLVATALTTAAVVAFVWAHVATWLSMVVPLALRGRVARAEWVGYESIVAQLTAAAESQLALEPLESLEIDVEAGERVYALEPWRITPNDDAHIERLMHTGHGEFDRALAWLGADARRVQVHERVAYAGVSSGQRAPLPDETTRPPGEFSWRVTNVYLGTFDVIAAGGVGRWRQRGVRAAFARAIASIAAVPRDAVRCPIDGDALIARAFVPR